MYVTYGIRSYLNIGGFFLSFTLANSYAIETPSAGAKIPLGHQSHGKAYLGPLFSIDGGLFLNGTPISLDALRLCHLRQPFTKQVS